MTDSNVNIQAPVADPEGRRPARSLSPNLRRRVWAWHFYAGLITLPVMIIASLTGAILIYRVEITERIDRDLHFISAQKITAVAPNWLDLQAREMSLTQQSHVAISAEGSGQSPESVYVYSDPYRATIFLFDTQLGFSKATRIAIDPYSGDITRVQHGATWAEQTMDWVEEIHRSLFSGWVGRIIVELTTVWGCVLLGTGIYLWWPKAWRIGGVWWARWRGHRAYVRWRDIHTIPSLYVAFPTMLILLSGLFFSPLTGRGWAIATFMTGGIPESAFGPSTLPAALAENSPRVSLDLLLAEARKISPSAVSYDIALPQDLKTSTRITAGTVDQPWSMAAIDFHPKTGHVLSVTRGTEIPIHGQPLAYAYGVHVGSVGGQWTKALAMVCCVVLIGASITGAIMWWIRRPPRRTGFPAITAPARLPVWMWAVIIVPGLLIPSFAISAIVFGVLGMMLRKIRRSHKPA